MTPTPLLNPSVSPLVRLTQELADAIVLYEALQVLAEVAPEHGLVDVHQDGEYHYDLVFQLNPELPYVVVLSTNCNGGIKEAMLLDRLVGEAELRRLQGDDATQTSARLLAVERTVHWSAPGLAAR